MDLLDRIKNDLNVIFKDNPNRLKHIYGVYEMSVELANILNVDVYKCSLIALLHDIHKNLDLEEQLSYLSAYDKSNIQSNVLAHAYSASEYARINYDILDKDVIIGIRSHVYGNLDMSIYDKIILVSDFCEKNRTYPYCIKAREILQSGDFEGALKMTLKLTIQSLVDRNIKPTEEQLEIYRKYGN